MIANYHTHTARCGHASGAEEEYVQNALASGMSVLGFADHSPYCYPDGFVSGIRMLPEELPGYVDTVLQLRQKYQGKIDILLGLEGEYYPALFEKTLAFWKENGIEYLILGQHFLDNDMGAPYCGRATDDEDILSRYCRQAIAGMETGMFSYFAHPDLIHYEGDEKIYRNHIRPLCQAAKALGLPLEINLLGLGTGRHYPRRLFWEIAAEEGCQAVLGWDAHTPDWLSIPETVENARKLASELGIPLLETVPLRKL